MKLNERNIYQARLVFPKMHPTHAGKKQSKNKPECKPGKHPKNARTLL